MEQIPINWLPNNVEVIQTSKDFLNVKVKKENFEEFKIKLEESTGSRYII